MHGQFTNLKLCCLAPEQHARTCNYWYTITTGWGTPHTAFETERGLHRWLRERGLEIDGDLPQRGTFAAFSIHGTYEQCSTFDCNAFEALEGEPTKVLDNAEYTLGILTRNGAGNVVVNHLNCNIHTRQTFEYFAARKEMS